MTLRLPLAPGRVYRTRELAQFSANPTRWAKRLAAQGVLMRAAHGLYYLPRRTRFGPAPPGEHEVLRAFLGDDHFVVTGSPAWNALDLGLTGLLLVTLVYNHYRTGQFQLDGQWFWLRRVRFPSVPTREWFVVDAFENHRLVGGDVAVMREQLARHLRSGRFDRGLLVGAAEQFASRATRACIREAVAVAAA